MRGSIGTFNNADGWIEVRIDGVVYRNGDDAAQIDPTDPLPACPNPTTGLVILGVNPFGDNQPGWDTVVWSPQGDLDCIYVKEVAAFCNDSNTNPNSSSRRCPPPGPGGSSFDGSASGPRAVQPGGTGVALMIHPYQ